MTAVAWNGEILVADSMSSQVTEDGSTIVKLDAVKIKSFQNLLYRGKHIRAIGFTGNSILKDFFNDSSEVREITTPGFFRVMELFHYHACAIAILDDCVLIIKTHEGKTLLTEHARDIPQALGCGGMAFRKAVGVIDPRLLVSVAMKCKKATGGTLTVWDGSYVHTKIPPFVHFVRLRFILASIENHRKIPLHSCYPEGRFSMVLSG